MTATIDTTQRIKELNDALLESQRASTSYAHFRTVIFCLTGDSGLATIAP